MKVEDIVAILKWAEDGDRCIKIEYSPKRNEEARAWVYDYDLMSGKSVYCMEDLPSNSELHKLKVKQLQEELTELLK